MLRKQLTEKEKELSEKWVHSEIREWTCFIKKNYFFTSDFVCVREQALKSLEKLRETEKQQSEMKISDLELKVWPLWSDHAFVLESFIMHVEWNDPGNVVFPSYFIKAHSSVWKLSKPWRSAGRGLDQRLTETPVAWFELSLTDRLLSDRTFLTFLCVLFVSESRKRAEQLEREKTLVAQKLQAMREQLSVVKQM